MSIQAITRNGVFPNMVGREEMANNRTQSSIDTVDTVSGASDVKPLSYLVDLLSESNHQPIPPNIKAEFAPDEPSHQIWINILNSDTGQILYKFPPETIRLLVQHKHASSLVMDVRS
ncbi:flagellar protein FlaG [Alicyclobacillus fastidiosus]|uniref:Flagellar protein FlaG n=1 Tax=Alicyclobacillus fastidiosus TaxID=392011 RepID=A0ABY6ZKE1_9BACL|nr:flagellar protein FlaG [Alicyclobacillus fastidiosus]WAH42651.1 flagellar protein FlaG [Alicyclobacillus fastidiosus]GMA64527.1 hypothetical protein GCM10025859_49670 [Alicyclobacillus fastidiosus]